MKGFALGLTLKQRRKATRKSPIGRTIHETKTKYDLARIGSYSRNQRNPPSSVLCSLNQTTEMVQTVVSLAHEGKGK